MGYRILLVDDEVDILEFIGYNLTKAGYSVYTATNGKEAIDKAVGIDPHLIILDVMMPEMDGIETCRHIRSYPELQNAMIAFLTARSEDYSQIAGFEAGADDYIAKPVRIPVLMSRIKAMFKRLEMKSNAEAASESPKSMTIDREKYLILKDGNEIVLPRKEFELISLLSSKPQRVFSREEIFSSIWGNDVIVGDRTIDVHIRKLREKLGDKHIVTVKGVGYKFAD